MSMYMYTYLHVHMNVHMDVYVCVSMYVYKYVYTHTCTHVYIYIYIETHRERERDVEHNIPRKHLPIPLRSKRVYAPVLALLPLCRQPAPQLHLALDMLQGDICVPSSKQGGEGSSFGVWALGFGLCGHEVGVRDFIDS